MCEDARIQECGAPRVVSPVIRNDAGEILGDEAHASDSIDLGLPILSNCVQDDSSALLPLSLSPPANQFCHYGEKHSNADGSDASRPPPIVIVGSRRSLAPELSHETYSIPSASPRRLLSHTGGVNTPIFQ